MMKGKKILYFFLQEDIFEMSYKVYSTEQDQISVVTIIQPFKTTDNNDIHCRDNLKNAITNDEKDNKMMYDSRAAHAISSGCPSNALGVVKTLQQTESNISSHSSGNIRDAMLTYYTPGHTSNTCCCHDDCVFADTDMPMSPVLTSPSSSGCITIHHTAIKARQSNSTSSSYEGYCTSDSGYVMESDSYIQESDSYITPLSPTDKTTPNSDYYADDASSFSSSLSLESREIELCPTKSSRGPSGINTVCVCVNEDGYLH